jgi:hypothetical protein
MAPILAAAPYVCQTISIAGRLLRISTRYLQKRQLQLLQPSKRAGRNSTALTRANTALSVMPRRRKGNDTSQTNGKRITASTAKGQQSTNKMHQPTKSIRTLKLLSSHFHAVNGSKIAPIPQSFFVGPGNIQIRPHLERVLKIDRKRDCSVAGWMARRDEGEYPSWIFD